MSLNFFCAETLSTPRVSLSRHRRRLPKNAKQRAMGDRPLLYVRRNFRVYRPARLGTPPMGGPQLSIKRNSPSAKRSSKSGTP